MSNPNRLFLIPLAGEGSRFPRETWKVPKPLIQFDGVTFLEYSIRSLPIKRSDKVLLVIRKSEFDKDYIELAARIFQDIEYEIVQLDAPTKGQADTVRLGISGEDLSSELWIHNGDSALNVDWGQYDSHSDGTLVVFPSSENRWSFARLGMNNYVELVTEKIPISNLASTGTYIFKTASDFLLALENNEGMLVNDEQYVAPLYNYLIANGRKIVVLPCREFFCLGTPEDFESSKSFLRDKWSPAF